MTDKAPLMLLEANFDINQVGSGLEYRFSRRDKNGNPIHGKDAGSIYFTVGEEFYLRIKGGSKKPFKSFTIIDCCLVSQPQIYRCGPLLPTEYAPPSPFLPDPDMPGSVRGASINIPGSGFVERTEESKDAYFHITQDWTSHLTVGNFSARWEISFVLTVRITPEHGESYLRVFSFDPETTVGPGSVPDEVTFKPEIAMLMPEPVVGPGSVPD